VLGNDAADATGLKAGIPVFGTGQDQKTAAYGAGITSGIATVSLGTAAAFNILTDRSINIENLKLPVCPYIDNGKWVLEGCVNTAGAAIKWLNNIVVRSKYAEMDKLCASSPPGSRGLKFYPFLEDSGCCQGINLGTGLEDIIRALYEGIVFEIKYQLQTAVKAGALIRQLNVFGGASKSEILCGILADVSGYPVQTFKNKELCLLGAAKMTAAALGADPETFARNSLAAGLYYEPNPENEKLYNDIYSEHMNKRRK
jgi:xylulokinase